MEVARECIQLFPGCVFNFVVEQRSRFELNRWVSSEEILVALLDLPKTVLYGDVFTKSPDKPVS
jgi:hypothetical protein